MSSLAQIQKLADRYPFSEEELEILLRCHADLLTTDKGGSFLNKLAHCSPYAFFFLPGDEIRDRVCLVESKILPQHFGERLRTAIFADAFPKIAHAGGVGEVSPEDAALETFLEGVADCGRRGPREALRVLYDCCSGGTGNDDDDGAVSAQDVITLCYRLSVAAEILVAPKPVDEKALAARLDNGGSPTASLSRSLLEAADGKEGRVSSAAFIEWADSKVPIMASTVLTFVQNIIFHGRPFPPGKVPYVKPVLDYASGIFEGPDSPLLFALGSMTPKMGGKWHQLYSTEASDGRSFNRMEWSVLGYDGPTTLVVKTEDGATLGAFAAAPWKESKKFYGNGECFLFRLEPTVAVYHATEADSNFMYCNASWAKGHDGLPHGIGFGGNLNRPRLFISEDFNTCSAGSLDATYQKGDLLPKEALEEFRIKTLEVWGVGGDEAIASALRARAEHREVTDSNIYKARIVTDKTEFLQDLRSGLIDTHIYKHREQVRGRAEFSVDEGHGGYALDRKEGETVPFPNKDFAMPTNG